MESQVPLLFFKQITFESNQSSSFSTHIRLPVSHHEKQPMVISLFFGGRLHFTSGEPDDKRPHGAARAVMCLVEGRGRWWWCRGGLTCLHLSKVTFRRMGVLFTIHIRSTMRSRPLVPPRSNLTPSQLWESGEEPADGSLTEVQRA